MLVEVSLPDGAIGTVPVSGGGREPEAEMDRLSNILKTFNQQFGTRFKDAGRVAKGITDDIAPKVATGRSYQNARKNAPNVGRHRSCRRRAADR